MELADAELHQDASVHFAVRAEIPNATAEVWDAERRLEEVVDTTAADIVVADTTAADTTAADTTAADITAADIAEAEFVDQCIKS